MFVKIKEERLTPPPRPNDDKDVEQLEFTHCWWERKLEQPH